MTHRHEMAVLPSCSQLRLWRLLTVIIIACTMLLPAGSSSRAQTTNPIGLTKTLIQPANGAARIGDPVIFEIVLSNDSDLPLTDLPLADSFDATMLQFTGATVNAAPATPDLQATGIISWTDLTNLANVGDLAPGARATVRTSYTALAVTGPGGGWGSVEASGPPAGQQLTFDANGFPATPNDFYELESRFVIDYALDATNGGIYLAVDQFGVPYPTIPENVYGFDPGTFAGTSKHPGGQALCAVYFLQEYIRLKDTGRTVTTTKYGVQTAEDMLAWARSCADFALDHLVIGGSPGQPTPPACIVAASPFTSEGSTCYYLWGFTDATGTQTFFPPVSTTPPNNGYPPTHHLTDSFVAWAWAALALKLQAIGDPTYTRYRDAAYGYWDWAHAVGPPRSVNPASSANPSFSSRDRFWAGVGITLYYLSVAEGMPNEAVYQEVLDCVNQNETALYDYDNNSHMRARCTGESYSSAYGRMVASAMEIQRGVDHYYTPGSSTRWHQFGNSEYGENPATPQNPSKPFAHGSGREYVAGVQRSHWFYYTFPTDAEPEAELLPSIKLPNPNGQDWTVESWSRYGVLEYWKYARENMWDKTAGYQAWWEAQPRDGSPSYKPCFSLGTPVPIGDWKAPAIGNKVHTINGDGSATVTVSGVRDPDWPQLGYNLRGIGVEQVRVYYRYEDDPNWVAIPAVESPTGSGNYQATIPNATGRTVLYYAEASDYFGNRATYPAAAPNFYQIYTLQDRTYNVAWTRGAQTYTSISIVQGPTAVTLASFAATQQAGGTLLRWQTGLETDNYGFHVYRSATADRAAATRITPALIAGQGRGSQAGATYSFVDANPPAGPAYYWLEDIDLNGTRSWHGPATPQIQSAGDMLYLPLVTR